MAYCPKCGNQVKEVENFCRACGFNLTAEETLVERKKAESSKEVIPERVKQSESASKEAGVGWMATGLICGIITLIGVFLPWGIVHVWSYESISISGWAAFTKFPDYIGESYPFTPFVLAGSIMMIVFALLAIIVALSSGSKAGRETCIWIAVLGGFMAVVASIWAWGDIHSSSTQGVNVDIGYG